MTDAGTSCRSDKAPSFRSAHDSSASPQAPQCAALLSHHRWTTLTLSGCRGEWRKIGESSRWQPEKHQKQYFKELQRKINGIIWHNLLNLDKCVCSSIQLNQNHELFPVWFLGCRTCFHVLLVLVCDVWDCCWLTVLVGPGEGLDCLCSETPASLTWSLMKTEEEEKIRKRHQQKSDAMGQMDLGILLFTGLKWKIYKIGSWW